MWWRIRYIRWYIVVMLLPKKPLIFTIDNDAYKKKCRMRKRFYKQMQKLREIRNERNYK